jgi:hypothetical protein
MARGLNRYQIRQEVRRILRDDTYPAEAIDAAINQIIELINTKGRFRCHQAYEDVTLITNTASYAITETILAEELVVFDPGLTTQKILFKNESLIDAVQRNEFTATGSAPVFYLRWDDLWYFDPVPNATANNRKVRIYHFKDLDLLTGDLQTSNIPARYHRPLLAMGAASDINPTLQIEQGGRQKSISSIFEEALKNFQKQELWEPLISHNLGIGYKFQSMHKWGSVGRVRG